MLHPLSVPSLTPPYSPLAGTRSRHLGSCCLSLLPLLDPAQERSTISAELRVTGAGGGRVAELRATAAKL